MSEVKIPAEIWCRTCGYFRPIFNQNKGKAEEFRERVNLKVPEKEAVPYNASTRKFNTL
jgi:hypothetical protein